MKTQKKPKRLERDIRKSIKQFLDLHRIWHFHILQGLGCYKGICDLFAVTDFSRKWARIPEVYAIEVKTATGRQSDAQKDFQAKWEARGHPYILARSADDVAAAMGIEIK